MPPRSMRLSPSTRRMRTGKPCRRRSKKSSSIARGKRPTTTAEVAMKDPFSFGRLLAMMIKELIQLRRDRLTFAMMVGIPIIQMALFGFAINGDPKSLPTAVVAHEQGPFTRSLTAALANSGYFRIVATDWSEGDADRALAEGEVQFVLTVPAGFARALQRGERPSLLVE